MIVGCAHDEALVHAKLREVFSDRVHIPLPSARERRRLMRTAWDNLQQQQNSSEPQIAYPDFKLDTVADSSAGLAVIPLLCAYKETVRALTSQLTAQSVDSASDAGDVSSKRGVSGDGSKQPFAQVAGLEAVKRVLQEAVLWPRQYAHLYRAFTAQSNTSGGDGETEFTGTVGLCAGILLFGPPGTHLCLIILSYFACTSL